MDTTQPDKNEYALDPAGPNFVAKIIAARLKGEAVLQEEKRHRAVLENVRAGNLSDLEQYLAEQAMLLNYMSADVLAFASATRSVTTKTALLGMGLKTQAACRKTILALNEMKNPKRTATFIKNQQNNLITRDSAKML